MRPRIQRRHACAVVAAALAGIACGVVILAATAGPPVQPSPALTGPPGSSLPGIAMSERSARRLRVREGDVLTIAASPSGPGRLVRIARVYRPRLYPTDVADRSVDVRLHLPDLQALLGGADDVDSIVVRLRDPARATEVTARLNTAALGFRAYTSTDLARRNSSTFEVIARFHRAISAVAILASSVFLLAIMTLRGEELRRQVGVMRLVGVSPRSVAASILLIATGVALLGSAVGTALGYGLSALINAYYRRLFDTTLLFSQVTPSLLGLVALLSVALGIGAGALTAWRLLRRSPLDQVGR
jgi:ABC-type lipoprotein release transport system permease subunit